MKFLPLFNHPILGRVSYGDKGIITSDGRKVIMIQYNTSSLQGFYQSSGQQSGYQGMWFPFDGDVTNSDTGEPILLKLSNTNFASQFKTFVKKVKESDVLYQKNMIKFGSLTFLYISYQLGGGLWKRKTESRRVLSVVPKEIMEKEVKSQWDLKKIRFPTVSKSQKEVNLYLGKAISFNFLKGIEYPSNYNENWDFDYHDIYDGKRFLFYPNTKIAFKRSLLTKCDTFKDDDSPLLLDFMMELDHSNTSFVNFFYPSIRGQSIFENRFCKKFYKK